MFFYQIKQNVIAWFSPVNLFFTYLNECWKFELCRNLFESEAQKASFENNCLLFLLAFERRHKPTEWRRNDEWKRQRKCEKESNFCSTKLVFIKKVICWVKLDNIGRIKSNIIKREIRIGNEKIRIYMHYNLKVLSVVLFQELFYYYYYYLWICNDRPGKTPPWKFYFLWFPILDDPLEILSLYYYPLLYPRTSLKIKIRI